MAPRTDERVRIALHPEIFKMLQTYKDKIHDHASKCLVPMSWNEFIMIIVNDWQSGRTKCVCGTIYDCEMCGTERETVLKKKRYELKGDD